MDFTIEVHRENRSYWAEVRELPGCLASGRTLIELREALEEALGQCLGSPAVRIAEPIGGTGVQPIRVKPGNG